MIILSFNCGSSSVKYQLYNWEKQEIIDKGTVERVTIGDSFCVHEINRKEKVTIEQSTIVPLTPTHKEAIKLITECLVHSELTKNQSLWKMWWPYWKVLMIFILTLNILFRKNIIKI
ncbi:acetate kinase [subsurface metagenome]